MAKVTKENQMIELLRRISQLEDHLTHELSGQSKIDADVAMAIYRGRLRAILSTLDDSEIPGLLVSPDSEVREVVKGWQNGRISNKSTI